MTTILVKSVRNITSREIGCDIPLLLVIFALGCPGWVVAMTLKSWVENRENRENRELTRIRVISAQTNFITILIIEIMITCYLDYPIKLYRDRDFGVKK